MGTGPCATSGAGAGLDSGAYSEGVIKLAHYAESFCLISGQCFRMIQAEDGTGHAQHCPYPIEWRGRFKDNAGTWHTVEACDGHGDDLDSVVRISGHPETAQEPSNRAF